MSTRPNKIGVVTATIVGMNAMIGAGIFTAPAALASYVGPACILVYLFVSVSVLCLALSLARLAALFPQEGSFYIYTSRWGGHWLGLLASILYIGGLIVAQGLLAQTAGFYITGLIPQWNPFLCGFGVLCALVFLNIRGVVLSQLGQYILIICTIFPLLATIVLCFAHANINNLFPFAPYGFGNILKAARTVLFGFFGFECATSLFNVVENPKRNVPRAIIYSITVVGILYALFASALILSIPLSLFSNPLTPLSETLKIAFPESPWLILCIHFSILSAIIGTIHSMIWSSSELALSLATIANKKIALYAKQHTTEATCTAVFAIGACIAIAFYSIRNLDLFFSLTAIGIIAALGLSLITLLTIKEEWQSGRNIITVIGLCTAGLIFYFAVQRVLEVLFLS